MHVTDLAINKTLGMQLAPPGDGHILEMPASPLLLNHVGTIHASVQFTLAEASSGEFLLRHLGDAQRSVFAVLRTSRFADGVAESLANELASRARALATVLVEVVDAQGVVTMTGQYDWFLQRQCNAAWTVPAPGSVRLAFDACAADAAFAESLIQAAAGGRDVLRRAGLILQGMRRVCDRGSSPERGGDHRSFGHLRVGGAGPACVATVDIDAIGALGRERNGDGD
jgi:acyl-coenzyme A thioesterase PaaI-like protein